MSSPEKKTPVLSASVIILSLLVIACGMFRMLSSDVLSGVARVTDSVNVVLVLFACFYSMAIYRMPHGNMLKYLMMAFGASLLFSLFNALVVDDMLCVALFPITMLLVGFMAGRLYKRRENIALSVIIGILLLVAAFVPLFSLLAATPLLAIARGVGLFTPFVIWFILCSAYFIRYDAHKEAGKNI